MSSIAELLEEASGAVQAAVDLAALDAVRVHYLGKAGGQLPHHPFLVVGGDYQRVGRHEIVHPLFRSCRPV